MSSVLISQASRAELWTREAPKAHKLQVETHVRRWEVKPVLTALIFQQRWKEKSRRLCQVTYFAEVENLQGHPQSIVSVKIPGKQWQVTKVQVALSVPDALQGWKEH